MKLFHAGIRLSRCGYGALSCSTGLAFLVLAILSQSAPANAQSIDCAKVQAMAPAAGSATIKITAPAPDGEGSDSWGPIAGEVSNIGTRDLAVAVYADTDQWYVQPWADDPLTKIEKTRTFHANIHLGHRYAALLVDRSFSPPATLAELPELGNGVVAWACSKAQ